METMSMRVIQISVVTITMIVGGSGGTGSRVAGESPIWDQC